MTSEEIQKETDLKKLRARRDSADVRKTERRLLRRRIDRLRKEFATTNFEPTHPDSDDMDDIREERREWELEDIGRILKQT